ncbi:hypothetical protein SUGI_0493160 [Cryptomeria japonica]|nr:hypothetical protein SUGI_0493160 [Cryptomeria japonica]
MHGGEAHASHRNTQSIFNICLAGAKLDRHFQNLACVGIVFEAVQSAAFSVESFQMGGFDLETLLGVLLTPA